MSSTRGRQSLASREAQRIGLGKAGHGLPVSQRTLPPVIPDRVSEARAERVGNPCLDGVAPEPGQSRAQVKQIW